MEIPAMTSVPMKKSFPAMMAGSIPTVPIGRGIEG
jgi:hypothetical protein